MSDIKLFRFSRDKAEELAGRPALMERELHELMEKHDDLAKAKPLLERAYQLELNDHIATQFQVIKEQINVKVLRAHLKMILSAHKSKARAEFQKKFFNMGDEPGFKFAFVERLFQGHKVKQIRIFKRFLSQRRLTRG